MESGPSRPNHSSPHTRLDQVIIGRGADAFARDALAAGIRIHACEGYDPESEGKVEAGVKYVKQDAFYGDTFADLQHLRGHLQQWLEEVANARIHGTTGRVPREHFEAEERVHLRPYLTPACLGRATDGLEPRKVDKTGLISWRANKYTVPMAYQQSRGGVREQAIVGQLGDDLGLRLCARLKATSPRIYKDQLRGANQLPGRGAGTAPAGPRSRPAERLRLSCPPQWPTGGDP